MISLSSFVYSAGFSLCLWLALPNGYSLQRQSKNPFYNKQYLMSVYNVSQYPNYFPFWYNHLVPKSGNIQRRPLNISALRLSGGWSPIWWDIRQNINFPQPMNARMQFQQPQKLNQDPQRDSATTTMIQPTKFSWEDLMELIRTALENDEIQPISFSQEDITELITAALETGELLYHDELIRRWKQKAVNFCGNSTFCEYDPDYPEQWINLVLQQNISLRLLAFDDSKFNVQLKTDDDELESSLCPTKYETIYPVSANVDGKKFFVINQKNLKQGLRVGKCITEDSNCDWDDNIIDNMMGYTVKCKQRYIQRELMVITPDDGVVHKNIFNIPSTCCCHKEYNKDMFDYRMRGS